MKSLQQMKQEQNGHSTQMNWSDAVRDLIKHENELISNRIGWMATLEGLLFASLSFSWPDPARGLNSTVLILCLIGIVVALISLWGVWIADNTIHKMLKELRDGHHSYRFDVDPPVWGPVHYNIKYRPWTHRLRIPWMWLPIVIILAWICVGYAHCHRSDPRLKGLWPYVVQEYMQTVFENRSGSETDKALNRLAGMPGDSAKGEKIFKESGCSGCHLPLKEGAAPSVVTLQKYGDHVKIVRGILNSEGKRQAHGKSMPSGVLSTMSPEEFLDVVEYLSPPHSESN